MEVYKGGFVSKETLEKIEKQSKGKSSWWLINCRLIDCTSSELEAWNKLLKKK